MTGATRGIGRAIALALARDGATVVGTATTDARRRDDHRALRRPATRARASGSTSPTAPRSRPRSRTSKRGSAPIAILVNNAGITRDNLLLRMKDDEWDAVMATNLKPAFRLAKACCAA